MGHLLSICQNKNPHGGAKTTKNFPHEKIHKYINIQKILGLAFFFKGIQIKIIMRYNFGPIKLVK